MHNRKVHYLCSLFKMCIMNYQWDESQVNHNWAGSNALHRGCTLCTCLQFLMHQEGMAHTGHALPVPPKLSHPCLRVLDECSEVSASQHLECYPTFIR